MGTWKINALFYQPGFQKLSADCWSMEADSVISRKFRLLNTTTALDLQAGFCAD